MWVAALRLRCLVVIMVLQACTMVSARSLAEAQCPGGRDKITPLLPPNFFPPFSCLPPPSVPTLETELGIVLPVVFNGDLGGAGFSLPGIAVGGWSIANAAFSAAVVYANCTNSATSGKPTIPHGIPCAPLASQTLVNRNTAVLYAVFGVSRYFNPATSVSSVITGLNLTVDVTCPGSLAAIALIPACVGLKSAEKMVELIKADKYNYEGTIQRQYNAQKFLDWVGFEPKNTAYRLTDRNRWQPLVESDGSGIYKIQTHVPASIASVDPFVLTKNDIKKRKVEFKEPTWQEYVKQADVIISASASLSNDTNKVIAEFFNGGAFAPLSYYIVEKGFDLMKALAFYQMFSLYHDILIITIGEKIRHNTVRPQSAVRHVYGDKKIDAWAGRGLGTQKICGNEWVPYLATAPEGEFPSGQVCFCTMFSEWIEKFIGTDNIRYPISVRQGCSSNEPGITPKTDITIMVETAEDFRKLCARGRVLGGMHFPAATEASQQLCKGIGYIGFDWIKKYWPVL